ncbi:ASCH domain-containing protein [Belliella sp. DSM 107340]|uniref:ASCH domain-containing protein n=1 Tax=Belliella calami TaxID=2923436 RepID=A0ABS9UU07_9BACT|nr:ASCH domain-containing protein [Belliella calami]MCH7400106.1 ASCH domain-containing protein [Belliella calami]
MLLGFKKSFAKPILQGSKVFTIRNQRKLEPKIGETLYMYTGLRTKDCNKITDKHKLVSIQLVDLYFSIDEEGNGWVDIIVDGRMLKNYEMQEFSKMDGFTDLKDFSDYWLENVKPNRLGIKYHEAEDMIIYHWTDLKL